MLPPRDLVVRPARTSDFAAICQMVEGLAQHHGDQVAICPEMLAELTLGPRPMVMCIVATLSNEPVGYGALTLKVQLHSARKVMDLQNLFVVPQLRGQGIGRALIEGAQLEARLAGCAKLTVGTAPGNDRAAALYRNSGFEDRPARGAQFVMAL